MRNKMKKIVTVVFCIFFIFGLVTLAFSYMEGLQRAMYHATELEKELESSTMKDKDVLLKKVRFIKERIREEMFGNPSEIKSYKQIK